MSLCVEVENVHFQERFFPADSDLEGTRPDTDKDHHTIFDTVPGFGGGGRVPDNPGGDRKFGGAI